VFADKLTEKIKKLNNPTVVGLDPNLLYVPEHIKEKAFMEYGQTLNAVAEAYIEFNKKLIDAVYDIVPAVKPQLAYYEMYGIDGIRAFYETCRYAKSKGLIVIADGKRNDIGSTAQAYSSAYLGAAPVGDNVASAHDADALTVNPYLGIDGIEPFINDCKTFGKGIFILVKTSNKSSGQLQDLKTDDGLCLYEKVAQLVDQWGREVMGKCGYSSIGAVVGATYPNQAMVLRKIMKNAYILVPGYGAQGGTAKDAVSSFNEDGTGAIINASRSIMCAWKAERWQGKYTDKDFDAAARQEAIRMRDEINQALESCLK